MKLIMRFAALEADSIWAFEASLKGYDATLTTVNGDTTLMANVTPQQLAKIISLASCFEHYELTLHQ